MGSRSRARAIRRRRIVLAASIIVGVVLVRSACGGSSSLLPGARWVATATVPEIVAYATADDTRSTHRLANPDKNGSPLVFLIDGDEASGEWLRVYLPVRPNGTKAWIRARDVTLSQTRYRIKVDLSAHTLTISHNRATKLRTPVGIGTKDTPTPDGVYYIKELIEPPTPDTLYGPYVFGLSGYSNTLSSFNGQGDGVIGIHGTNDESSIGKNLSAGCLRVPNKVITRMAKIIPLGTPVEIVV